ncbi:hypothetical protein ADK67_22780 [Saccharothrix sp. NRRL B-16348]|uniref:hypothetical protein n=1 Tax=Saccharothrix sp. NRRL B-16348 TaxID=1415542 RepID=UPI0006AE1936|nr:hypothetical protein [Saccharothrix sp. NRRL B-16348]KOX22756.1 hypothetical protein ADK67_22780 [Saccharothrix sp. NRRL B-16348]
MNPNPSDEHEVDRWLTERTLDAVGAALDLDAGLAAILPAAPRPPADAPPRGGTPGTTLREFADHLATRPPHERLVARTWLPRLELAAARSFTRSSAAVRAFDHDLARARDIALTERIEHRLAAHPSTDDLVRVRADLRDRARDLRRDRGLADVLDRAVLSALDLGFGLDLGRAGDGARDLARGLDLAVTVELALHQAVTTALEVTRGRPSIDRRVDALRVLLADIDQRATAEGCLEVRLDGSIPARVRDAGFVGPLVRHLNTVRAAVRDVVFARDRSLADLLALVLGEGRDLALDQARGRATAADHALAHDLATALGHGGRPHDDRFDAELVDAVDRIEDAATNLVDADLAHVPLDGIPLTGLRWSTRTRWHVAWHDRVRRGSVELRPGLFEVRGGNVGADDVVTDLTT